METLFLGCHLHNNIITAHATLIGWFIFSSCHLNVAIFHSRYTRVLTDNDKK